MSASVRAAPDGDYIQLATPNVTIEVTRDRFVVTSQDQAFDLTHRDLIVNVFALLKHTPLTSIEATRTIALGPVAGASGHLDWTALVVDAPWQRILGEGPVAPDAVTVLGKGPADTILRATVEDSWNLDAPLLVSMTYHRPLDQEAGYPELASVLGEQWDELIRHSDEAAAAFASLLWVDDAVAD